jgi:hypothetical protein
MPAKIAGRESQAGLSRREFSRILAVGTVSVVLPSGATPAAAAPDPALAGLRGDGSEPSAEAEAQYTLLISKHGACLSEEQKGDVRRLIDQSLKSTAAFRSFHLDNSDEPGNVFRAKLIAQE